MRRVAILDVFRGPEEDVLEVKIESCGVFVLAVDNDVEDEVVDGVDSEDDTLNRRRHFS